MLAGRTKRLRTAENTEVKRCRPPAERTQSAEKEEKLAQADDLINASRGDDAIDTGGL